MNILGSPKASHCQPNFILHLSNISATKNPEQKYKKSLKPNIYLSPLEAAINSIHIPKNTAIPPPFPNIAQAKNKTAKAWPNDISIFLNLIRSYQVGTGFFGRLGYYVPVQLARAGAS